MSRKCREFAAVPSALMFVSASVRLLKCDSVACLHMMSIHSRRSTSKYAVHRPQGKRLENR